MPPGRPPGPTFPIESFPAIRSLLRLARHGFLFGALAYGAPLALTHLAFNRVESLRNGIVACADFMLLYGLWCAATFLLAGGAVAVGARLLRRPRPGYPARLLAGLLAFNLVFAWAFALYGLTYDQGPFGALGSRTAMFAWVGTIVLVVGALVAAASWLVQRLLLALGPRRGAALAGALASTGLLAACVLPLVRELHTPVPRRHAGLPVIDPTGLDVVLVAFDGATWRVANPLLAKGQLPTFRHLLDAGTGGDLASFPDSNSAVLWASIYSGASPARHGVLDFYTVRLPGMTGPGLFPVHRTFFKEWADLLDGWGLAERTTINRFSHHAMPIWEILDHLRLTTGVVDGYYFSLPALAPQTPGSFFLSYGLDAYLGQQRSGARPASDLPTFLQPPPLMPEVEPTLDHPDFYWQSAALEALLGKYPQPRFLNFYTHEPDSTQHLFWKWYEPQLFLGVDPADVAAKGDRIPALYRDFDAFLGDLGKRLSPSTVLIVASDHGHTPTMLHSSFYTQHRHGPPGIVMLSGGPIVAGSRLQQPGVLDLYPTILYLLGLPVPDDAAGRVLTEAIDPAFLRQHPIQRISSYEGLWPPRLDTARGSGLDEEELRKLKALGYI